MRCLYLLGTALVLGCSEEWPSASPLTQPSSIGEYSKALQDGRYIPVGTVVPVGVSISAPPEPFDHRRHTRVPNELAARNLVGRPGVTLPPRWRNGIARTPPSGAALLMAPPPGGAGDADAGLILHQATAQWYGAYQLSDVGLGVEIPERSTLQGTGFLYAPTLLAPGQTCIEVTTIHLRHPGPSESTEHYQGWYDWCESGVNGAWAMWLPLDAAFQNRYVRVYAGVPTVTVAIVTPTTFNGCWYSDIYDYLVGGWTQVFTSCASPNSYSPGGQYGWTFWESWGVAGANGCPSITSVRALEIQLANPQTGSWQPLPASDQNFSGNALCWTNVGGSKYTFHFPGDAVGFSENSWLADTFVPPPLDVSIDGLVVVDPQTYCSWTAAVSNGVPPFQFLWGGVLSGDQQSVWGQISSSGEVTVQVEDSIGATGQASVWITVDPLAQIYCL